MKWALGLEGDGESINVAGGGLMHGTEKKSKKLCGG